jgi:hypothetical protein
MYEHNSLQALKQGDFDEFGPAPALVVRYGKAHARALAMAAHIRALVEQLPAREKSRAAHIEPRAGKLEGCGSFLAFREYFTVGETRLTSASFCHQDRLCPLCAIRRGGRYLRAYGAKLAALRLQSPGRAFSLLTLTVKDGDDLGERFGHLTGAWDRLMHRRRNALAGRTSSALSVVEGGVASIEVKRGQGSGQWHPHLHAVVASAERLGQDDHRWPDLAAEWLDLTGDSHVVDVRPIRESEPGRDLTEVFKYALKFADLDLADNLEAALILHGKQLVRPFGCFVGVDVPASLVDEPLAPDLPFMEVFYRYAGLGVYRLVGRRTS